MSTPTPQDFATAWTQAVMAGNRTGKWQHLWMQRDQILWGAEIPDFDHSGAMRTLDRDEYQQQLKLPGADQDLEAAVFAEALIVAPYWLEYLNAEQWVPDEDIVHEDWEAFEANFVPPPPRPPSPKVITPELRRSFAESYATAVVEATKSRMAHYLYFSDDAGQFKATLLPFGFGSESAVVITGDPDRSSTRLPFGSGLQLDPRHPDFNEAALRADVFKLAAEEAFANRWAMEVLYPPEAFPQGPPADDDNDTARS